MELFFGGHNHKSQSVLIAYITVLFFLLRVLVEQRQTRSAASLLRNIASIAETRFGEKLNAESKA